MMSHSETINQQKRVYRVQALDRALDILDCFTFQHSDMSLSEVVFKTGLNKTTAKRFLSNLTARKFLQQDRFTNRYQLGIRLFELGGIVFSSFDLRKTAAYYMDRLHNVTGATVLLGIMLEDQLVYLDKREGQGMIRISSDIGWRRPLHFGMLGMVLIAFLEEKDLHRVFKNTPLEAHTPFSITDKEAFSLRLKEIRNNGYVLEKEEAHKGVIGIAAPIRNYSHQVIAALGIALPASQSNLKINFSRFIDLLKKTCEEISADLGYLKI
ncbi:MAG TPA: IclR family transcriptional regulator [Desulfobacteraceae bacterium]|nr:IclR family transcriptional regulator [Desulfobacteraceae bacterium]HPQ28427.1 IclR family transcriptional regulator [Desulfobacteraceae bacterium]